MQLRELGPDDAAAGHELGRLAFGGEPGGPVHPLPPGDTVGAFDERGRLVARAVARPYEQWWCGRPVPMAGIAGVAVHPDARGQGLVGQLMAALVNAARERGQPVSTLFPTSPGIYRGLGWEVVGSLDTTRVPLTALGAPSPDTADRGVSVTSAAGPGDAAQVAEVYAAVAATGSGLLTRTGPSFPDGAGAVLSYDVVALARDQAGRLLGYVSYDRGRGYRGGAALRLGELVSLDARAAAALLRSLGTWAGVVDSLLWRGPLDDLSLRVPGLLPAPEQVQPWMLRVLDPAGAVAARGFLAGMTAAVGFALHDPSLSERPVAWRLEVAGGRGQLEKSAADDLPVLEAQGLALLYAGVATPGRLVREGLLDRDVPGLEAAFAGPRPALLDYF